MNLKNSILKTIILLLWTGSLVIARLYPTEPATWPVARCIVDDSIPYYGMMNQLLNELVIETDISSEDFLRAFNNKEFDITDKMLSILGSQIQANVEDKGLYCFLLGAYHKIKGNNDKKFTEEIPAELFHLGALYCDSAAPYCDNLFKEKNLPKINTILKKSPPHFRLEKLKSDYEYLRGFRHPPSSIDEICFIFPSLTLCQYSNNANENMAIEATNKEEDTKGKQEVAILEKSNKTNKNTTYNESNISKPKTYKTAEEKYDFLKDYDPEANPESANKERREITQEDILNDQKKRYEKLHEIIVQYFKTNAHERNIRADCYLINSYRTDPSDIGLKVRLTVYEDEDRCTLTPKTAEALTDCLIGVLKRHENITETKFKNVSTSITIHCPKGKINSASIAEKFADIGVPNRNISQKNGDFSIELYSSEFYNEELNRLNKKIQDYKKFNQKN